MKNQTSKTFPYARLKAMKEIMTFIKNPKWSPEIINIDIIKMLNIAPHKESLVVAAINFLGLIDDMGKPTDKFFELKKNYKDTLQSITQDKYHELFSTIPEELIDQPRTINFFMSKSGTSKDTAEYQGMFFGWLCREADISLPLLPTSFKRARFDGRN